MGISTQITVNGKIKRIGNYAHVKEFRRKKKLVLVKIHGGQCRVCGYNKCLRNLDFHHIDPSIKSFGLASGVVDFGIEKSITESKKCILVCSNCHGEIHEGLIDASKYFVKF
jgi:predicted HNH restriction endonuclease